MKKKQYKINAAVIALIISLIGCSTVPNSPMSTAESQLDEQSSWFSRSDVQGAIIGGVIGGGIAALMGGDGKQIAASTVGGGAVGYGAGAYMRSLQTSYHTKEAKLNKVLSDIQQDNQRIGSYLSIERQVIKEKMARLTIIKEGLQQKTMSVSNAQSEIKQFKMTEKKLRSKANDLSKLQNEWQERYDMLKIDDPRLEREIAVLQQKTQIAHQDVDAYKKELDKVEMTAS